MVRENIRILLIEDNPGDARLIREMLNEGFAGRFSLQVADRLAAGLACLAEAENFDLVLLDLSLPDSQGLESLDKLQAVISGVAVVVLSGTDDEDVAVNAVNRGAQDYLIKGQVDANLLPRAIRYAVERKRIERELRHAVLSAETEKAKADAIVAGMGCGICIVDLDFLVVYQNEVSCRLEGMRIGEPCFGFCGHQGGVCPECPVSKAMQDGRTHRVPRTVKGTDGEIINLEIIASPLWDADGRVVGGIKVVNEVTERVRAARELEKLGSQNELLLNSVGEGILGLDMYGRHTFVNPAAARMLGYEGSELVGKISHPLWHHSWPDGTPYPPEKSPIYAAFREGVVKRVDDEVFWRKDGSSFPVEYVSTPIWEEGRLAGAVVAFLDISKRKAAENSLRISEEKHRDLLENANDLIQSVTADGRFQYVNRAWHDTLGYEVGEVGGLNILDVVSPEYRGYCERFCERVKKGETVVRADVVFLTKAGQQVILEGSVSGKFEEDVFVSSRWILRNITERKKAEREKARMQGQLLQAQKMEAVGTLAGGVAHDFNNLLTTIQGYTELAMRHPALDEGLASHLHSIRDACRRAADIVRQLLLFSRKQAMESRPVNLNVSIKNLLKLLERLIGEDVAMETELDNDLASVSADPGNLDQVIMNLVVNARDAMPEGGVITIATKNMEVDAAYCQGKPKARPGRFVRLTVADTGSGLDEEIIHHIFEPFFTTKETGKGTGLGLSVAYGIVEQLKGWMEVENRPGRGAVFSLFLPAMSGKGHSEAVTSFPLDLLKGNGERILVVEDEDILRNFAVTALEKSGYLVKAAESGKEALAIFEEQGGDFHMVFCDVVLPDINGLQLADAFLAMRPELKILLSSGYTDAKAKRSGIEDRQYSFLSKPYTVDTLLRTFRKLLT